MAGTLNSEQDKLIIYLRTLSRVLKNTVKKNVIWYKAPFNVHVVFISTPDMKCRNISMAQARKNLLNKKPLNVIILFQVT